MAELERIEFQSDISTKHDTRRNERLLAGIVEVETLQEQDVLSGLDPAAVDRLADAMQQLLVALNARAQATERMWCWHLALTLTDGRGQGEKGTSTKPPE